MSGVEISEKEYEIMSIIEAREGPVGSGVISQQISRDFDSFSEATIGRVLRRLDQRGFTEKEPYRGRNLTDKGKSALQEYRLDKKMKKEINEFLDLTKVERRQELLDMLIARRAIEREIVKIAAPKITEKEVQKLKAIIEKHHQDFNQGGNYNDGDKNFHLKLAEIAGNSFLEASLKMIRNNENYSPALEQMRTIVGSKIVDDHSQILSALESGSPDRAEKAMVNHLDNIIRDIKLYWESELD
ncbi:MAG: FCD domain-containing protein [Halanaerobiaceae bacterium]